MSARKLFVPASCFAVLALLLASCAPAAAPTVIESPKPGVPTPTPKPAVEKPRYGGILTRALNRDVATFDVHREAGNDASATLFNVYQGLVRLHPIEHQKIMPELAEKWEISPDGKAYTFKFYKDIKWHDGQPFTMEDVVYSLDRMHNPGKCKTIARRGEALLEAMDTAQIVDKDSVKISTRYPSASFLSYIATGWVAIQPKHILVAKGDMKRDLVGTGPFKFKGFQPDVSLELEKNPNYHFKELPYLDGIKFYTIKDAATRFAAFRTGKVKMTHTGTASLTISEAEMVRKEMADRVVVYEHDSLTIQQIRFNMKRKPWDDVRVRKAVDLAYDRQAAIRVEGGGYLSSMYMGFWGKTPEELSKLLGYRQPKDADIAEAKKLLAEVGFSDGFKTALLARAGGVTAHRAVVDRDQLAKIGIHADLVLPERVTFDDRQLRGDFDVLSIAWAYNTDDPDETLFMNYKTGAIRNFGLSDKTIDELIEKQARTMDPQARKAILEDIEQRVLDKVPGVLVFRMVAVQGAWKEVKNFSPGPGIHPWGKLDQTWLAK